VPPKIRVIGYVRVSTGQQAEEGVSLDAQRVKLEAYAVAHDLELVAIVADEGLSAKTIDRPELQRALARLEAGEADGLLVPKLDRLTRSVRDLGELLERYFAKRFSLFSVADSIDTRTAGGRLCLNVLASVSQWEREAISERTKDALAQVRREGGRLGGVPLGHRLSEETDAKGRRILVPDEGELAAIERIRVLYNDGCPVRAIARALESEGAKTKRGGKWSATLVQRVIARLRGAAASGAAVAPAAP